MISDADIWRDPQRRIEVFRAQFGAGPFPVAEALMISACADALNVPRDRVKQVLLDRITMAGGG